MSLKKRSNKIIRPNCVLFHISISQITLKNPSFKKIGVRKSPVLGSNGSPKTVRHFTAV